VLLYWKSGHSATESDMPVMVIGMSMIVVDGSYLMPESFKRREVL